MRTNLIAIQEFHSIAPAPKLRDQMLGVLTPDQRTQYDANLKTLRADHKRDGNGPFAPNASPTPRA